MKRFLVGQTVYQATLSIDKFFVTGDFCDCIADADADGWDIVREFDPQRFARNSNALLWQVDCYKVLSVDENGKIQSAESF